jgi:hypothetical protein
MNEKVSHSRRYSPISMRIGLLLILLTSGTAVFSSLAWIFQRVRSSQGLEIAEVVVAVLVIFILALIVIGFRAGFDARQSLRQRRRRAFRIYCLIKRWEFSRCLWDYIGLPVEIEQISMLPSGNTIEMVVKLDASPKRGRPPTFPIERWTKVVSAWENRNRWQNTMTLQQFLAEEFGINADGSPLMSVNTYYDWRKKVHEEQRRQQEQQKKTQPT